MLFLKRTNVHTFAAVFAFVFSAFFLSICFAFIKLLILKLSITIQPEVSSSKLP